MKTLYISIFILLGLTTQAQDSIPEPVSGLSVGISHDFPFIDESDFSNYSLKLGYYYQLYKSPRAHIIINPHLTYSDYQITSSNYFHRDTFNIHHEGIYSNNEINLLCSVNFSYQIFKKIPLEFFAGLSLGVNIWNETNASYTESKSKFHSSDIISKESFDNVELKRSRFAYQFPYMGVGYVFKRYHVQLIHSSGHIRILDMDEIGVINKSSIEIRLLFPLK